MSFYLGADLLGDNGLDNERVTSWAEKLDVSMPISHKEPHEHPAECSRFLLSSTPIRQLLTRTEAIVHACNLRLHTSEIGLDH